jgi:recombination protein RecR
MVMNDTLTTVTELLKSLQGIGPRQARRLAFWFVRRDGAWINTFAKALIDAKKEIVICDMCKRLYSGNDQKSTTCALCTNKARDTGILMIVEKDVDLENIEKTGAYRGRYFVLGGTTSPLDKEPEKKVRSKDLLQLVSNQTHPVQEIIFALSATTEGEDTILYLEDILRKAIKEQSVKITKLGRGLSTGTELEYVDKDTMSHALKGRS